MAMSKGGKDMFLSFRIAACPIYYHRRREDEYWTRLQAACFLFHLLSMNKVDFNMILCQF
jgi:hypothetical protein